jgi:archaellum component FlaC
MKTDEKIDLVLKIIKEEFTKINGNFEQVDSKFAQINNNFEQIDSRFKQINNKFEQIDSRFEQIDNRFDGIEKQLNQQDQHLERIEDQFRDIRLEMRDMKLDIRRDGDKLEKVYETRHKVEYKITNDFILRNLGWNLSIIIAGLVVGKIVFLS